MIFKFSLLITFLFVTNYAAEVEQGEPFSVKNEWKKSACKTHPDWTEGVQKYYNDAIAVLDSFPSEVFEEANYVKTTFQTLVTKLIYYSNSKSKILSTGATIVLEAFSQIKFEPRSAQGAINEFYRVLPIIMRAYKRAVTNLSTVVGNELVNEVNNALNDLECAFELYVETFNVGDENELKREVDYEPIMKCVEKLFAAAVLKDSVTLSDTLEVQDAKVVISFVLDHLMICTDGLRCCSDVILLEQMK